MKKKGFFGILSLLFLAMILFSPKESNVWITFLILAVIFGIIWHFMKN